MAAAKIHQKVNLKVTGLWLFIYYMARIFVGTRLIVSPQITIK